MAAAESADERSVPAATAFRPHFDRTSIPQELTSTGQRAILRNMRFALHFAAWHRRRCGYQTSPKANGEADRGMDPHLLQPHRAEVALLARASRLIGVVGNNDGPALFARLPEINPERSATAQPRLPDRPAPPADLQLDDRRDR